MKKNIILFVMICAVALSASAQDSLYLDNMYIYAGETKMLSIMLNNDVTYCGLQTDLYLSEGLSVPVESGDYAIDATDRLTSNHSIASQLQADGGMRIFVASQSSAAFIGNSGAVLIVKVKADADFNGKGMILLKNSKVVEQDATKHLLKDFSLEVGGLIGDVNEDGFVNVSDVTALVSKILGSSSWKDENCDINGDGKINVSDATALMNIILKG